MKFHLPSTFFTVVLTTAFSVNGFQNQLPSGASYSRMSAMKLKAATKEDLLEAKAVTKEDLLGARDDIDTLLREKACGMYMYCIHYSVVSGIVSYRIVSQFCGVWCGALLRKMLYDCC